MAEYTSEVKVIPHSQSEVFAILSDLNNLALAKDLIPQDKVKDFSFDSDSCTLSVDPVGNVKFTIVEREPNTSIKFTASQLPFGLNMWINLEQNGDNECKMGLTVIADLNPFLKPMLSKPLQQGVDKIAEALVKIPYSDINNSKNS